MWKYPGAFLLAIMTPLCLLADVVLTANKNVQVNMPPNASPVMNTAFRIFADDYKKVFNAEVSKAANTSIFIGTVRDIPEAASIAGAKTFAELNQHVQAFLIKVKGSKLYILGSDEQGVAYGILDLSRLIGVSPWEWWADVPVARKTSFILKSGYTRFHYPSVKFRGIFLNDEDWGLQPWAAKTYEPETKDIGPKTYAKIFELMLRLRANLIWPAMHSSTKAFFHYPGNRKVAEQYGIYIGSSHAEPMLRNNVDEWNEKTMGPFNYLTNKEKILSYWEDRVKETQTINAIYTLGLRGVHDSKMEGANTVAEQKQVLDTVLRDQRALLKKYINPAIEKVPQAFIPYKEVQDIYDYGIELPEDISLVWCDDNYGYIKHFPAEAESGRKGGNGVYYHVSYWGRPHDYLWLATTHPAQLYGQMKLAYEKGARDIWVLNVGDLKPAEYLTELFLDMAWNIGSIENNKAGLENHLFKWTEAKFGAAAAKALVPVMREYYRLAYIRKPEFMGGTRTEEADPKFKIVADLPFTEKQIRQRLADYAQLSDKVVALSKTVSPESYAAWYQLFEYPVRAAAEMNKKQLYGQLARHGKADWAMSDKAYENIIALTEKYNALNSGKWKGIMDSKPRKLAVFDKVPHTTFPTLLLADKTPRYLFNGNQYKRFTGSRPVALGMGYGGGAVTLQQGASLEFDIATTADSIVAELALAPNHPVAGKAIRYAVQLDNQPAITVDYATQGRSEEWKQNVLCNQAIRKTTHRLTKAGKHTIKITAVDEGVVVDQVKIW